LALSPSYRALLGFRPGFLVVLRGFVARPAFRAGFLAPAFAVFLATGFLEALRTLALFALGFVDCFFLVELFFFADAALAFRVALEVRFLAAPIAAPESAPITVPTTGTPNAVPATAPATAPPRVLPAVPVPASVLVSASPLSLSSMFFSPS
jgi:hypothetical protein